MKRARIEVRLTENAGKEAGRRGPWGAFTPARFRVTWSVTERWDPARPATDYEYRLAHKRNEAGSVHVYGTRGLLRALGSATRSIIEHLSREARETRVDTI